MHYKKVVFQLPPMLAVMQMDGYSRLNVHERIQAKSFAREEDKKFALCLIKKLNYDAVQFTA